MTQRIGFSMVALAALGLATASASDAEAFGHRNGSCGSHGGYSSNGGHGSNGSRGSFGGLFSRFRGNGSCGSHGGNGSYGGHGSRGGHGSCGGNGGYYHDSRYHEGDVIYTEEVDENDGNSNDAQRHEAGYRGDMERDANDADRPSNRDAAERDAGFTDSSSREEVRDRAESDLNNAQSDQRPELSDQPPGPAEDTRQ